MAEENEKKPGFVVHKKQQDAAPAAATEKKKVVVVKKKAPGPQTNAQPQAQKHVVVKKSETAPASPAPKAETKPAAKNDANRTRTFELNSARPNVKAGNLSDKPRQGGYNRDRSSQRRRWIQRLTGSSELSEPRPR